MTDLKRHQLVYRLLVPVCKLFVKWKFNYTFDDLSQIEGPYLLLPNHNLELDPIIIGVTAKNQLYFVASEHLTRKGFATKLLNHFFQPIIRQKGTSGANTVAKILRTLRNGSSVCIFPEGNRSFNGYTGEILPATGKMAKRCGAKVITYRVEGGYLTQPRWSTTLRRGKLTGRLIHVYTPEELSTMTDQEVNQAICRDLYEDAYQTQNQNMIPYKGKRLALGMETTLFACPVCNQIGTLQTDDSHLFCSCGFRGSYDEYGYINTLDGKKHTISALDNAQQNLLAAMLSTPQDAPLFSDNITLETIDDNHTLRQSETGTLVAFYDRLECCGHVIPFTDLQGIAVYSRNVLVMYTTSDNQHYEIRGNMSFSALKYQYWYDLKRKIAANSQPH